LNMRCRLKPFFMDEKCHDFRTFNFPPGMKRIIAWRLEDGWFKALACRHQVSLKVQVEGTINNIRKSRRLIFHRIRGIKFA
jgi:hypothetical protein